jgi:hypothetical protein
VLVPTAIPLGSISIPFGLYLYVENVDEIAAQLCELGLHADPDETTVRVGWPGDRAASKLRLASTQKGGLLEAGPLFCARRWLRGQDLNL